MKMELIIPDPKQVKRASMVLRAVNHPMRKRILEILIQNPGMTVTELWIKIARSGKFGEQKQWQSVVSQQLAVLRKHKFVIDERKGKNIHYYFNENRYRKLINLFKECLEL